eukprot:s3831_g13.t1
MGDLDLPGGASGGVLGGAGGGAGAEGADGAEGAAGAGGTLGGTLTGGALTGGLTDDEVVLVGSGGFGGLVFAGTRGAGAEATFGAAVSLVKPHDLTSQQSSSTAMSLSAISCRTKSHSLPA